MVTLRFAVPTIIITAGAAVCLSYFVISPLPARYETNARLLDVRMPKAVFDPPSAIASEPTETDRPPTEEEVAAATFQKAAEEILRKAPNTSAAFTDELPIAGRIPLPRKRPIARSGSQAPSAPPALGSNAQQAF
jgi:hypothetical protein